MSILHEYSVIGHSRAVVGRWLGVVAGLALSLIGTLIASIAALATVKGYWEGHSIIILPLTATTLFAIGHWIFDTWGWRSYLVYKIIGIPCLAGEWECEGKTINPVTNNVDFEWKATITISQKWEKIVVTSKTTQSSSHSISASLIKTEGLGYTLMYSYKNDPQLGEPELKSHIGYAQWQISDDLNTAEAFYFNSKGRVTSGVMKLKKNKGINK